MTKTPGIKNSKTPSKSKGPLKIKIQILESRLQSFFERVIRLCKRMQLNAVTQRIVSQVIGSGGSIAANYAEASEAMSKKDFVKSIKTCRKEAKESRVWLKGLKLAVNFRDSEFDALIQEATEFIYIFTSILVKTDKK